MIWSYSDTAHAFGEIYHTLDPAIRLFPEVQRLLHDETVLKIACEDMYMLSYRSALTDLFPLMTSHSHATGQLEKLKAQPWFPFWRILRNSFAHGMIFNFNPAETSILPVSWSGVTLDLALNGKPLTLGKVPYAKMFELLMTAQTFCERDLR